MNFKNKLNEKINALKKNIFLDSILKLRTLIIMLTCFTLYSYFRPNNTLLNIIATIILSTSLVIVWDFIIFCFDKLYIFFNKNSKPNEIISSDSDVNQGINATIIYSDLQSSEILECVTSLEVNSNKIINDNVDISVIEKDKDIIPEIYDNFQTNDINQFNNSDTKNNRILIKNEAFEGQEIAKSLYETYTYDKTIIKSDFPILENHVLVFINGILRSCDDIPIYSYKDSYYGSTNFIIDGKFYNLANLNDIITIPDTMIRDDNYDLTKQIEYLLYMSTGTLEENGLIEQSIECLKKSNQLKTSSNMSYLRDDYMKLCRRLVELGRFDEAEQEYEHLKQTVPDLFYRKIYRKKLIDKVLNDAEQLETDLIKISSHSDSCSLCSRYQGKVFSISGNDKRFPKLPETIKQIGGMHVGCRHVFNCYFDDNIEFDSEEEKERYFDKNFINDLDDLDDIDADYEEQFKQYDRDLKYEDRIEYYKLYYKYPELAPKSFNSYRRMKNNKTKGFISIMEKLKQMDYDFFVSNFEIR